MGNWLARWVASGIALALVANLHIGVSYSSISALVIATIVISLVNSIIRPVALLLTLPINCLTLGLFGMIVNAALFYFAGNAVKGFHVDWPWGALLGPMLMSFVGAILNNLLVRPEDERKN